MTDDDRANATALREIRDQACGAVEPCDRLAAIEVLRDMQSRGELDESPAGGARAASDEAVS